PRVCRRRRATAGAAGAPRRRAPEHRGGREGAGRGGGPGQARRAEKRRRRPLRGGGHPAGLAGFQSGRSGHPDGAGPRWRPGSERGTGLVKKVLLGLVILVVLASAIVVYNVRSYISATRGTP